MADGTTGVDIVLSGGPGSITQDLDAIPSGNSVTFGNRTISVQKASAGGTETLTCQVTGTGGLAIDTWRVRMSATSAPAAPGWRFQQAENDPSALTITRLMCDPAAGSASADDAAGQRPGEDGDHIHGSRPRAGRAVVGSPQPDVYANWDFTRRQHRDQRLSFLLARARSAVVQPDLARCLRGHGHPGDRAGLVRRALPGSRIPEQQLDADPDDPAAPPAGHAGARPLGEHALGRPVDDAVAAARVLVHLIVALPARHQCRRPARTSWSSRTRSASGTRHRSIR